MSIIHPKPRFVVSVMFLLYKRTSFKILIIFIISYFLEFFISAIYYKKIFQKLDKLFNNFTFTSPDWFLFKIPLFFFYFKVVKKKNSIISILEIGSYEGRSAIFFLNFFKKSKIICVDPFFDSSYKNLDEVYHIFIKNMRFFKNFKMKKMVSNKFFLTNKKYYDLIYIDGSHAAKDVYKDLINSYKFAKINSYILLDDFLWRKNYIHKSPIDAINLFLKKYNEKIKIIYCFEQMLIQKIA